MHGVGARVCLARKLHVTFLDDAILFISGDAWAPHQYKDSLQNYIEMYSKFVFNHGLSLGFVRELSVLRQTRTNILSVENFKDRIKDSSLPVLRSVLRLHHGGRVNNEPTQNTSQRNLILCSCNFNLSFC